VFGHGAEVHVGDVVVIGCYHPSQQNTFTGKLTNVMTDTVMGRAAQLAAIGR
jgi:uracil-DNA glycosylase